MNASVTITGIKHIRFTASAVREKIERIRAELADDGTGWMETPDGLNENDLGVLAGVLAALEAAGK